MGGLSYLRGEALATPIEIMQSEYVIVSQSANTVLDTTKSFIRVSGTHTWTLPTAVGNDGLVITFFKTDSNATTVTISCNGAQSINGHATVTFAPQFYIFEVISNGTNWDCINAGVALA